MGDTWLVSLTPNEGAGPEVIKLFSNSTEHEIYNAHNVHMSTIVGILTFISMKNKTF